MTVSVVTAAANDLLNLWFNDTATTLGSGRWLALAINSSLTEVTDGAYARYDLDAVMPAASGGSISNSSSISANVGAQTATHWFVIDAVSGGGTLGKIVSGSLNTPKTGAFSITAGLISFTLTGA